MNERARRVWGRTTLRVWPGEYRLVSLAPARLGEAAALGAATPSSFVALVRERDEVSLTLLAEAWAASALRPAARAESGPLRVITLDADLEPDLCGYLAPVAERLAAAGVPIVPQCAFGKDHLLVPAGDLETARRVLEDFIAECRS